MNLTGTALKFGDCPNITSPPEYLETLAALEKLLNCGGWCGFNTTYETSPIPYYFYRFSSINDCNSKGTMRTS
jgi:hypothetical protein